MSKVTQEDARRVAVAMIEQALKETRTRCALVREGQVASFRQKMHTRNVAHRSS